MWGNLEPRGRLGRSRGRGSGFPHDLDLDLAFVLCLGGCCPVELELPDLARSKSV